jgi:hypothetical protein
MYTPLSPPVTRLLSESIYEHPHASSSAHDRKAPHGRGTDSFLQSRCLYWLGAPRLFRDSTDGTMAIQRLGALVQASRNLRYIPFKYRYRNSQIEESSAGCVLISTPCAAIEVQSRPSPGIRLGARVQPTMEYVCQYDQVAVSGRVAQQDRHSPGNGS